MFFKNPDRQTKKVWLFWFADPGHKQKPHRTGVFVLRGTMTNKTALLTTIFAILATNSAFAAEPQKTLSVEERCADDKPNREASCRAFWQGADFYDKKQYSAAIAQFRLAQSYFDTGKFEWNIGRCYQRMGDLFKAKAHYELYLKSPTLNADDRAEGKKDLAEVVKTIEAMKKIGITPPSVPEPVVAAPAVPAKAEKPAEKKPEPPPVEAAKPVAPPAEAAKPAPPVVAQKPAVDITVPPAVPIYGPEEPPAPAKPTKPSVAAFAVPTVLAVGLVGASAWLYFSIDEPLKDLKFRCYSPCTDPLVDQLKTREAVSFVLGGAGIAAGITAMALGARYDILARRYKKGLTINVTPTLSGVVVGGGF